MLCIHFLIRPILPCRNGLAASALTASNAAVAALGDGTALKADAALALLMQGTNLTQLAWDARQLRHRLHNELLIWLVSSPSTSVRCSLQLASLASRALVVTTHIGRPA